MCGGCNCFSVSLCSVCDRKDESLVASSSSHRGIFVWRLIQAWSDSRKAAPDRKRHGELCYDSGSAAHRTSCELYMHAGPLSWAAATT